MVRDALLWRDFIGPEHKQGAKRRAQGAGRRAQGARATSWSDVSVALLLSASESAAKPASPISLDPRLQPISNGQGCSVARLNWLRGGRARFDLLELRQRRVALERLRERRGARLTDLVVDQSVA